MNKNIKKIGWRSAAALVVANMIGTGVFTTLGFQLNDITSTWSIIGVWLFGGVISLLGAFSYAELGTHLRKSGGEYHFISQTIHPFWGYLSGWVSLTVGFSAPIALAAMGMSAYLHKFLFLPENFLAILTVVFISVIHSFSVKQSSRFQVGFTLLKVVLIAAMIVGGLMIPNEQTGLEWSANWVSELKTPGFAVCLIFVTYAFSGWNAAAYIVDEIDQPKKNLPIALIGGTILVSILYVFLQMAFLKQVPIEHLRGRIEVGQVVAEHMFGGIGGQWISVIIALLLISSISAMVWVGSRVIRAMAEDYPLWNFLGHDNAQGIPVKAIWLQSALSILLILTGSFEKILLYSG
ncbi:MAG: amino acid permease, partial [Bacteroidota bacterium]